MYADAVGQENMAVAFGTRVVPQAAALDSRIATVVVDVSGECTADVDIIATYSRSAIAKVDWRKAQRLADADSRRGGISSVAFFSGATSYEWTSREQWREVIAPPKPSWLTATTLPQSK
jgi:hypothetical protein